MRITSCAALLAQLLIVSQAAEDAMPCGSDEALTAKDVFEKATGGDLAGGMALLAKLEGGAGGPCATCLLGNLTTPEATMPKCVGSAWTSPSRMQAWMTSARTTCMHATVNACTQIVRACAYVRPV